MTDETCPFCGSPIFDDSKKEYQCGVWQGPITGHWYISSYCLENQRNQLLDKIKSIEARMEQLKNDKANLIKSMKDA